MVTVIIVVYNASRYLRYSIDSVFNQSYKDFEVIAIDDGSSDPTLKILNEYTSHSNFTLLKHEHTQNLGGNRNIAVNLAKGEYISFIDGDDIWEKDKLQVQLKYIDKYDMICTNAYVINENNEITAKSNINDFDNLSKSSHLYLWYALLPSNE